jgi:predicted HicB family RNase H-like nuclease
MKKLGDRTRLTLRMPEGLAQKLEKIAQERGVSLNAYLTLCFEKELFLDELDTLGSRKTR